MAGGSVHGRGVSAWQGGLCMAGGSVHGRGSVQGRGVSMARGLSFKDTLVIPLEDAGHNYVCFIFGASFSIKGLSNLE